MGKCIPGKFSIAMRSCTSSVLHSCCEQCATHHAMNLPQGQCNTLQGIAPGEMLVGGDFSPSKHIRVCPPNDQFGETLPPEEINHPLSLRSWPTVGANGRLEGGHDQFRLGRFAGECAADFGVRVHGNVFASSM